MDFQPEYVVYRNRNSSLSRSALEIYDRGDFWEMFDFLGSTNPVGEVNTDEDLSSDFFTNNIPVSTGEFSSLERSLNVSRSQQSLEGITTEPLNVVESVASSSVLNGKIQQSITPITTNLSNPPTTDRAFSDISNVIGKRSATEVFDRSSILTGVSDNLDRR
jgi:hypothetical protein